MAGISGQGVRVDDSRIRDRLGNFPENDPLFLTCMLSIMNHPEKPPVNGSDLFSVNSKFVT
jgi:hypothetical protein